MRNDRVPIGQKQYISALRIRSGARRATSYTNETPKVRVQFVRFVSFVAVSFAVKAALE